MPPPSEWFHGESEETFQTHMDGFEAALKNALLNADASQVDERQPYNVLFVADLEPDNSAKIKKYHSFIAPAEWGW